MELNNVCKPGDEVVGRASFERGSGLAPDDALSLFRRSLRRDLALTAQSATGTRHPKEERQSVERLLKDLTTYHTLPT